MSKYTSPILVEEKLYALDAITASNEVVDPIYPEHNETVDNPFNFFDL